MPYRDVTIISASGLHARPAAIFSKAAAAVGIPITLFRLDDEKGNLDGEKVNAASVLGLMGLGIRDGETVRLTAEGADADRILAGLAELLGSDLDQAWTA